MSQTVAFIGLGNMGGPMAANLAVAGFRVRAFDLSQAALDKAVSAGCEAADNMLAAVDGANFVITMLPSGPIVEAVFIQEQKLLEFIAPSALIIDCSTIAPEDSRRVAKAAQEKGLRFMDAPVSGGTAAAAAGTLAFMCGGADADFEQSKTVLTVMGANIFHAGGAGAGSVAKLCNNMLLAIHMIGTCEALQMGVNNGLDPKVLSEIILKSSGCNWSLEKYNPYPGVMPSVPSSNDYQGGFMINLMLKDLNLAMDTARQSRSTAPLGALAQNLYSLAQKMDEREGVSDFSSVLNLMK